MAQLVYIWLNNGRKHNLSNAHGPFFDNVLTAIVG